MVTFPRNDDSQPTALGEIATNGGMMAPATPVQTASAESGGEAGAGVESILPRDDAEALASSRDEPGLKAWLLDSTSMEAISTATEKLEAGGVETGEVEGALERTQVSAVPVAVPRGPAGDEPGLLPACLGLRPSIRLKLVRRRRRCWPAHRWRRLLLRARRWKTRASRQRSALLAVSGSCLTSARCWPPPRRFSPR